ncbi:MAG: cardiolipin synthase [Kiritimatiellae bacterium]|nr:cardiolipin synthase [Kiritimatiellia bacterium]
MNSFPISIILLQAWLDEFWLPFDLILHLLAFFLVTIHCLRSHRESTSALLWIFVAWTLPLIGPLLYLWFGINRVPEKAWHKHRSDQKFLSERKAREDEAMPLNYWRAVHDSLVTEPSGTFARELNSAMNAVLSDYPLLSGNNIEPLVTGDQTYPKMLEAIRQAKNHVHIQTFIIGNDRIGRQFLDLLKQKAESGVSIRFMYDRFGSTHAILGGLIKKYKNIPNMQIEGWTQANLIKRRFQINLRNHRKILIVDGKTAFLGGINLQLNNITTPESMPIRDYHFKLEGPIVQELQYTFLRDWYFMTDEDPEILLNEAHFPHTPPVGNALVRVINGGPTVEVESLTDIFFTAIVSARKQLLAVTPYFAPTPDILRAFRSAALRGVDVKLIVPEKNNHVYAGMAGRALYDTLLSAGVRIFERHPPFLHAKALIVDDTLAIIGTANLDARSMRLNYETNLAVYNDAFADELKEIVLEEISMSDEIELASWRNRPVSRRLVENFCNLFTPIL